MVPSGYEPVYILKPTRLALYLAVELFQLTVCLGIVIGAKGGAGDAVHHSKYSGSDTSTGEQDCPLPRHPVYQNHLASGIPPLALLLSDRPDDPAVSHIVYGDAAYGARYNWANSC